MPEPTSAAAAAAGGLLAKLLPAGIGAAIMVAVHPPQNKRELFARLFVAFACSYLFYGFTFDLLHSFGFFAFLDKANEDHAFAVRGLLGACGWFFMGGTSMLMQKFRTDPLGTMDEVKKELTP